MLATVRDPNSGLIVNIAPTHVSDSGYDSGNLSNISLEPLDVERSVQRASREQNIRPRASDKSLFITFSTGND